MHLCNILSNGAEHYSIYSEQTLNQIQYYSVWTCSRIIHFVCCSQSLHFFTNSYLQISVCPMLEKLIRVSTLSECLRSTDLIKQKHITLLSFLWCVFRRGQMLSVRGEKVSEWLFLRALKRTVTQWPGARLIDYSCVESGILGNVWVSSSPLSFKAMFQVHYNLN